jgi:hypothetical protein
VNEIRRSCAEELQPVIADAYREAITTGAGSDASREAAERLLSRVDGTPTEHVETTVAVTDALSEFTR